ncbi:MAG: alpha/beta hydrolase [Clostridiales bacterium]|nr:alpha/beta hydrolase [Clostridiales bacterium]
MLNAKESTGATPGGSAYILYSDIPYVENAHPKQALDLYLPVGTAPEGGWPLLLYVHGGGFIAGDKVERGLSMEYSMLSLDYGIGLASVDYRLIEDRAKIREEIGMQIADVQSALRFCAAQAEALGINKGKIAFMGPSAGGALVCAVAARAKAEGDPPVAAVVSIASATDFTKAGEALHKDAPPVYIIHGTEDSIVKFAQAEAFAAALEAAGVPYEFVPVYGGNHTRPMDDPNTMQILKDMGRWHEAYDWLAGILGL